MIYMRKAGVDIKGSTSVRTIFKHTVFAQIIWLNLENNRFYYVFTEH